MRINSARELEVYKKAYSLAMDIFYASEKFPVEERHALNDQICRASRSVCQNLREAWSKRRCQSHFVSKLTDCDGENSEVDTCLDFALDCGYRTPEAYAEMRVKNRDVGRMLGSMINNPQPFVLTSDL
ncbi:MAG: four helix bundle protein [Methylacidiphilales bacterium]|nr:four helix bundle protein [Candidatus Methylacidiphilales bacterium]